MFLIFSNSGKDGPIAQFWLERTPDKREVTGSRPVRPTKQQFGLYGLFERFAEFGGVAQLGERLPCTQEVIGSNPFTSTNLLVVTSMKS